AGLLGHELDLIPGANETDLTAMAALLHRNVAVLQRNSDGRVVPGPGPGGIDASQKDHGSCHSTVGTYFGSVRIVAHHFPCVFPVKQGICRDAVRRKGWSGASPYHPAMDFAGLGGVEL